MKKALLSLLIIGTACNQPVDKATSAADTTILISADTIPQTRKSVNTSPVAEYSEPIKDELNDWKFAVAIYETQRTFHYTLRMRAKEVRVSDSLIIPNFGIQPKVAIHKGKEPFSCIIGFFDKKDVFKEYKKVSFKNDQLHMSTINYYYAGISHIKK